MLKYKRNSTISFLVLVLVLAAVFGQGIAFAQGSEASLKFTPDQVVISPDLLKNPVAFSGSGFGPKEIVVLEIVLPKGVTVKGIPEGENGGLGNATADEKGDFKGNVSPSTVLNTLFQVDFTERMTPNFEKAKPLPPGVYEVIATGMNTEKMAKTSLTVLPPPQK
jgi:hypothetical protein